MVTNGRNLEVALRIKAQTEGREQVDALGESLEQLGDGAEKSLEGVGEALSQIPQEADKGEAALDALGKELAELEGAADKSLDGVGEALTRIPTEAGKGATAMDALGKKVNAVGKEGSLPAAAASVAGVGKAAAGAGEQLRQAFGVVGVRSANDIQAEIHEINQALTRLGVDSRVSGEEFDRAWAAGQQRINALEAELRGASSEARRLSDSTGGITTQIKGLVAAYGGMQLAREFLQTNIAGESLARSLTILKGDAGAARKEIEWLEQASNRLGVETLAVSQAYVGLVASAKGSRLEGEATRAVFEAVAGSMARLGKSTADTEGALLAISQMVGKGTVSMEEMRLQLAERLPGAMQATADAMGITVGELTEMISSGKVLAEDLIPKLTEGLNKLYGTAPVEGAASSWARFKNSIAETMQMFGQQGGIMDAVIGALGMLNGVVRAVGGSFEYMGKLGGTALGGLLTFDLAHPIASLREFREELELLQAESKKRWGFDFDAITAMPGFGLLRAAWQSITGASDDAADSAEKAAEATAAAGDKASAAASGFFVLEAAYQKNAKAAEAATGAAEKAAAARKAEGQAALSLAQAFGSETERRQVAESAARRDADALAALAAARRQEAVLAQQAADDMAREAAAAGAVSEKRRETIQQAQQKAGAMRSEADAAAAAALQAQQHAQALSAQGLALQDNAGRVDELRVAMEAAAAVHLQNIQLNSQGDVSQAELAASQAALAEATYLYRDALSDLQAARQRDIEALRQQHQLNNAQLSTERQIAQAELALARARGDRRIEQQAMNKLRQIEIKQLEVSAEMSRAEAKAILAGAEAEKVRLVATGEMTAAKQAEIDKMIASAKLKELDAEKSSKLAELQRELARELENVARSGRRAGSDIADSYSDAAKASDRLNESLRNRPAEGGGGGSSGSGGGGNSGSVSGLSQGFSSSNDAIARANGVRGEDVGRFSQAFGDALEDELADMRARLSGQINITAQSYNLEYENAWKTAVARAKSAAKSAGSGGSDARSNAPRETERVERYEVLLKDGNRDTVIRAADQKSAQAIVDALKAAYMTASTR